MKFVAGEHVTCDVFDLKLYTGSFEASFPAAWVAGKSMTCTYVWGGQSAPITFRVPARLTILSPRENEHVFHGTNTTITYSGEPDTTLWVVALGTNVKAVAKPEAITPTQAVVDTSALAPGAGSIALTEPELVLHDIQGLAFQSVGGRAWAGTMVSVTWV